MDSTTLLVSLASFVTAVVAIIAALGYRERGVAGTTHATNETITEQNNRLERQDVRIDALRDELSRVAVNLHNAEEKLNFERGANGQLKERLSEVIAIKEGFITQIAARDGEIADLKKQLADQKTLYEGRITVLENRVAVLEGQKAALVDAVREEPAEVGLADALVNAGTESPEHGSEAHEAEK